MILKCTCCGARARLVGETPFGRPHCYRCGQPLPMPGLTDLRPPIAERYDARRSSAGASRRPSPFRGGDAPGARPTPRP